MEQFVWCGERDKNKKGKFISGEKWKSVLPYIQDTAGTLTAS